MAILLNIVKCACESTRCDIIYLDNWLYRTVLVATGIYQFYENLESEMRRITLQEELIINWRT